MLNGNMIKEMKIKISYHSYSTRLFKKQIKNPTLTIARIGKDGGGHAIEY